MQYITREVYPLSLSGGTISSFPKLQGKPNLARAETIINLGANGLVNKENCGKPFPDNMVDMLETCNLVLELQPLTAKQVNLSNTLLCNWMSAQLHCSHTYCDFTYFIFDVLQWALMRLHNMEIDLRTASPFGEYFFTAITNSKDKYLSATHNIPLNGPIACITNYIKPAGLAAFDRDNLIHVAGNNTTQTTIIRMGSVTSIDNLPIRLPAEKTFGVHELNTGDCHLYMVLAPSPESTLKCGVTTDGSDERYSVRLINRNGCKIRILPTRETVTDCQYSSSFWFVPVGNSQEYLHDTVKNKCIDNSVRDPMISKYRELASIKLGTVSKYGDNSQSPVKEIISNDKRIFECKAYWLNPDQNWKYELFEYPPLSKRSGVRCSSGVSDLMLFPSKKSKRVGGRKHKSSSTATIGGGGIGSLSTAYVRPSSSFVTERHMRDDGIDSDPHTEGIWREALSARVAETTSTSVNSYGKSTPEIRKSIYDEVIGKTPQLSDHKSSMGDGYVTTDKAPASTSHKSALTKSAPHHYAGNWMVEENDDYNALSTVRVNAGNTGRVKTMVAELVRNSNTEVAGWVSTFNRDVLRSIGNIETINAETIAIQSSLKNHCMDIENDMDKNKISLGVSVSRDNLTSIMDTSLQEVNDITMSYKETENDIQIEAKEKFVVAIKEHMNVVAAITANFVKLLKREGELERNLKRARVKGTPTGLIDNKMHSVRLELTDLSTEAEKSEQRIQKILEDINACREERLHGTLLKHLRMLRDVDGRCHDDLYGLHDRHRNDFYNAQEQQEQIDTQTQSDYGDSIRETEKNRLHTEQQMPTTTKSTQQSSPATSVSLLQPDQTISPLVSLSSNEEHVVTVELKNGVVAHTTESSEEGDVTIQSTSNVEEHDGSVVEEPAGEFIDDNNSSESKIHSSMDTPVLSKKSHGHTASKGRKSNSDKATRQGQGDKDRDRSRSMSVHRRGGKEKAYVRPVVYDDDDE